MTYYHCPSGEFSTSVAHHMQVVYQPICQACSGTVSVKDSVAALFSNANSTDCEFISTPFPFPNIRQRWGLVWDADGRYGICNRMACPHCSKSAEAFIVHTDCLKLLEGFGRQFSRRWTRAVWQEQLRHIWIRAAWKRPWGLAPSIYKSTMSSPVVEIDPQMVYDRAAGLGIPQLKKLPRELVWLIRNFSSKATFWRYAAALSTANQIRNSTSSSPCRQPICEVESWQRGNDISRTSPPRPTSSFSPPILRLGIDANGINILERVAAVDAPIVGYLSEHYIVEDEKDFAGITCELADGLLRLQLPPNHKGFRIWDTPNPPALHLCKFYPQAPIDACQIRTINLKQTTGLTFFYNHNLLVAIHNHTPKIPTALSTFDRFINNFPDWLAWIAWVYFPIADDEEILALRVLPGRHNIQITTNRDRISYIGLWETVSGSPLQLISSRPTTLLYQDPDIWEAIQTIGVYCDGAGSSDVAPNELPRLPSKPSDYSLEWGSMHLSSAPLENVTTATIFYDPLRQYCKGILLHYKDGTQQALGQCGIGVFPEKRILSPSLIYFQHVQGPFSQTLLVDFLNADTQASDWSRWSAHSMSGKVEFLFNLSNTLHAKLCFEIDESTIDHTTMSDATSETGVVCETA